MENGSGINTRDVRNKLWMGIVEDVKDPNRKGRIKVRVQGLYNNLPIDDIPYASPYQSIDGRDFRLPAQGKIINVVFPFNNVYDPYYVFSENYNINLRSKLEDLDDEAYGRFVALLFDDRTQIYSDDENLTFDYKYNKMTIDNDTINLELKDNVERHLNLGSADADQQAILGNHFMEWLDDLVKILEQPTSLIGNMGSAILKPQVDLHLKKYHILRETFLSINVNIVDNYEVKKLE